MIKIKIYLLLYLQQKRQLNFLFVIMLKTSAKNKIKNIINNQYFEKRLSVIDWLIGLFFMVHISHIYLCFFNYSKLFSLLIFFLHYRIDQV